MNSPHKSKSLDVGEIVLSGIKIFAMSVVYLNIGVTFTMEDFNLPSPERVASLTRLQEALWDVLPHF